MNCTRLETLLDDYVDDLLAPEARAELTKFGSSSPHRGLDVGRGKCSDRLLISFRVWACTLCSDPDPLHFGHGSSA